MTTGSTYKTPGYSTAARGKATQTAAQAKLAAQNQGPADVAQRNAINRLIASGNNPYSSPGTYQGPNNTKLPIRVLDMNAVRGEQAGNIQSIANQKIATAAPVYRPPVNTGSSGGGGGYGGGGGGGGAVAAPMMSQSMIDWIAELLRNGAPQPIAASVLDLPDYTAQAYRDWDPAMFNQMRSSLAEAKSQDQGTIEKANADLLAFLGSNYRNAFANADVSGGPQMGASADDLTKLMQAQGVNASPQYAAVQAEGQRAQQMAGDWRSAMAANEDIAQRARISSAGTNKANNLLALSAADRAGQLGIGMQESTAKSAWQQAADAWNAHEREMAYNSQVQESMANWQRQNQVQDLNLQTSSGYNNQVLQAMLDLAGQNIGNTGITLPGMPSLGLAPAPQRPPRPVETAEDPLHWAQIDWDLKSQGLRPW